MIDILSPGVNAILGLGALVVLVAAFALVIQAYRNKRLRNRTEK